jgi:GxxExxY protein
MLQEEKLTDVILGAAIEVHRELGPGLLESAYEQCLCHELHLRKLSYASQVDLPVRYKQRSLDCGYRMDIVVENKIVLELKSVDEINNLHKAQLLTYLKLSQMHVGFLLNFNVPLMKDGFVRMVQ